MRFKELRGVIISVILSIIDIVLMVISVQSGERGKLIAAIVLGAMIVMNFLGQFYIRFFDDGLVCYHMMALGLLAKFVDYKDIQDVSLKGKHHVLLATEKKTFHLYVMNGQKLYDAIVEKKTA